MYENLYIIDGRNYGLEGWKDMQAIPKNQPNSTTPEVGGDSQGELLLDMGVHFVDQICFVQLVHIPCADRGPSMIG